MIVLPPKRFHPIENSLYDPIRPKPWFGRMDRRRRQIPRLRQAYELILADKTQKEAAAECKVNPRELRDYVAFRLHESKVLSESRTNQAVLDEAYAIYCANNAQKHIRHYIERVAPKFGIDPRHVTEAWETNPTFYPTGYNPC